MRTQVPRHAAPPGEAKRLQSGSPGLGNFSSAPATWGGGHSLHVVSLPPAYATPALPPAVRITRHHQLVLMTGGAASV